MAKKKWSTQKKVLIIGGGGILVTLSLFEWQLHGDNPIQQIKSLFSSKTQTVSTPIIMQNK